MSKCEVCGYSSERSILCSDCWKKEKEGLINKCSHCNKYYLVAQRHNCVTKNTIKMAIFELIASAGKADYSIEKSIGIPQGSISNWKNDKYSPGVEALVKIADYFNVSLDSLVGRDSPAWVKNEIPNDVQALWKSLDAFQRAEVKGFMQSFNKKTIKN